MYYEYMTTQYFVRFFLSIKNNIYCYFHDLCAKKMLEQKRFAGRHLLTFESQKLNYFGKKGGPAF
jgi:hypothetical protein